MTSSFRLVDGPLKYESTSHDLWHLLNGPTNHLFYEAHGNAESSESFKFSYRQALMQCISSISVTEKSNLTSSVYRLPATDALCEQNSLERSKLHLLNGCHHLSCLTCFRGKNSGHTEWPWYSRYVNRVVIWLYCLEVVCSKHQLFVKSPCAE